LNCDGERPLSTDCVEKPRPWNAAMVRRGEFGAAGAGRLDADGMVADIAARFEAARSSLLYRAVEKAGADDEGPRPSRRWRNFSARTRPWW
jgi:hypothetical protein